MKKTMILLAAALLLTACSNEEDALNGSPVEQTNVTLTFSPYELSPMTRTATSIAGMVTHLDVWVTDGTNEVSAHQSSTDDNFGSVTFALNKTKTYTLTAVAHKCTTDATLTNNVIAFPEEKVSLAAAAPHGQRPAHH